jgi:hypothetical protein
MVGNIQERKHTLPKTKNKLLMDNIVLSSGKSLFPVDKMNLFANKNLLV